MSQPIAAAREWHGADATVFREQIVTLNQPAVLRGLIKHWPAVQAGWNSARALGDYIKGFDSGGSVDLLIGEPSIQGRFFYREEDRKSVV